MQLNCLNPNQFGFQTFTVVRISLYNPYFTFYLTVEGANDLGFIEDDLEEDFDPDKYDKRMSEVFQVQKT